MEIYNQLKSKKVNFYPKTEKQENMEKLVRCKFLLLQGHTKNMQEFLSSRHVPKLVLEYLRNKYMPLELLPDDQIKSSYKSDSDQLTEKSALWDELEKTLTSPNVSPLFVDNLKNLPLAYITVCSNDVLRDDGIWYAHRLPEDRVHLDLLQCFHGWNLFTEDLTSADKCAREAFHFIRQNL